MRTLPLLFLLLLSSCGRAEREREAAVEAARAATLVQIERVLSETIRRADRLASSADRILRPLPVMTPAEEEALRRPGPPPPSRGAVFSWASPSSSTPSST